VTDDCWRPAGVVAWCILEYAICTKLHATAAAVSYSLATYWNVTAQSLAAPAFGRIQFYENERNMGLQLQRHFGLIEFSSNANYAPVLCDSSSFVRFSTVCGADTAGAAWHRNAPYIPCERTLTPSEFCQ